MLFRRWIVIVITIMSLTSIERTSLFAQALTLRATLEGVTKRVSSLAFSPDGKSLVSGGGDGKVILWDLDSNAQKWSVETIRQAYKVPVAFRPQTEQLAWGYLFLDSQNRERGQVKIRDLKDDREVFDIEVEKGVTCLDFSPDGKLLAMGAVPNVIVKDLETNKTLFSVKAHEDVIFDVRFSPDGQLLASGGGDATAKIWTVKTGKIKHTLTKSTTVSIFRTVFSSDGTLLATPSENTSLWEIGKLKGLKVSKPAASLPSNGGWVHSAAFSPNGKLLACGSADGEITLWDVKTRKPLSKTKAHTEHIHGLVFSPDGKTLASGSDDALIKLWDVSEDPPKAGK